MSKPKYPVKEVKESVGKVKIDGKYHLVTVNQGRLRIFKEVISDEYWAMAPIDEQVDKLIEDNCITLHS